MPLVLVPLAARRLNPALRKLSPLALVASLAVLAPAPAHAFCGFYVGKSDQKLINESSQVAIVRSGDRTVITMASDYKGELADFAMVVPVPTVLQREQIHIGDMKLIDRLEAFSMPRLVEYFDPDPCPKERQRYPMSVGAAKAMNDSAMPAAPVAESKKALGVTVEASYTVGEYDIVLLSATQSDGLAIWLSENGYRMPPRTEAAVRPYVKQEMKFFVAKVNLKEQKKTGAQSLRPIQIAFESPKFMLPIRLGMANAEGAQDLTVFLITQHGRVESTNYQTIKISTDANLPEYVQGQFPTVYKALFDHAWTAADRRAVVTEFFWNMSWCDPCATQPLAANELRELGAFWVDQASYHGGALPALLTRLHVRYDNEHFPEDLAFQETGDQTNFQGRYVLNRPFKGDTSCPAGRAYVKALNTRRAEEAKTLARLTGWEVAKIRSFMGPDPIVPAEPVKAWWKSIWQR